MGGFCVLAFLLSASAISVTRRLGQTAEVIGIPLIDHIVVGVDKAISTQE
jgi:DNA repair protein RadC